MGTNKGRDFTHLVLVMAAALVSGSCRLDYKSVEASETEGERVPNLEFYGLNEVIVRNGKPSVILSADSALQFVKSNQSILENASFIELTENAETATTLRADTIIINTKTQDATLTGNVETYTITGGTRVQAESLVWTQQVRILNSQPDEWVSITRDDGSSIRGMGFIADMRRNEFSFSERVTGQYVQADE